MKKCSNYVQEPIYQYPDTVTPSKVFGYADEGELSTVRVQLQMPFKAFINRGHIILKQKYGLSITALTLHPSDFRILQLHVYFRVQSDIVPLQNINTNNRIIWMSKKSQKCTKKIVVSLLF